MILLARASTGSSLFGDDDVLLEFSCPLSRVVNRRTNEYLDALHPTFVRWRLKFKTYDMKRVEVSLSWW